MSDKLYEVKVSFVYYAKAKSAREAARLGRAAVADLFLADASLPQEVTHREWQLQGGWDRGGQVYSINNEDVTIGDMLAALPTQETRS